MACPNSHSLAGQQDKLQGFHSRALTWSLSKDDSNGVKERQLVCECSAAHEEGEQLR